LGLFLTWLWVVGITNALNLMDGLDGLAGGVAYVSAMSLLFVSAQFPYWAAGTLVLAALAGAALGFLRHNLHPSRIILGDAGAYFLGYTLAATALLGNLKLTTLLGLLPPALFLLLPILDTTQVVVRRLLRGQNPLSTPGKDHIHHRLLARGLSQRRVAFLLWGLALLFNLLAMAYLGMPWEAILASLLATVLGLAWVTYRRLRALLREVE
jgi:UDP-GlcNAc:undecaprenyl-phosphate GlcNAc-1-phosphate transferase